MPDSSPSDRGMSGDVGLAQVNLVVEREQRGHFLDHGLLLRPPARGGVVRRDTILPVMQGKPLVYQPDRVARPRTLSSQVIDPLLDYPRRYQSIQIAHRAAVGQRRRQYQPSEILAKHPRLAAVTGVSRVAKSSRNIAGASR